MTDSPKRPGPGSTFQNGQIKLLSRLGLGGFGEVFLAETRSGLKAVKVVDTASWSEQEYRVFNAMLMVEASYLSTLEHPMLPKSSGLFAEQSRYFLVMDWVKGEPLREHVKRNGPLGPDEVLKLTGDLTDVLCYLHRRKSGAIVFGDLKPDNILRTKSGEYRLVDLGLVSKEGTRLSLSYAVFSPNFAAPEKMRGEASHPLHDIYSLGATIYFALTGRDPVEKPGNREVEKILTRVFSSQDGTWGADSLQSMGQLLALALTALEPEPERRPSHIVHFQKAWKETAELRSRDLREDGSSAAHAIIRSLYSSRKVSDG